MASAQPRFDLGAIVATPGVLAVVGSEQIGSLILRHVTGDWGEVGPEDSLANEEALREGFRLLSAYTVDGTRLWIITEADRSVTTVLLPSEY